MRKTSRYVFGLMLALVFVGAAALVSITERVDAASGSVRDGATSRENSSSPLVISNQHSPGPAGAGNGTGTGRGSGAAAASGDNSGAQTLRARHHQRREV
jgi:hypothetical protein